MRHQFYLLLESNGLRTEAIARHLEDALAELADGVRDDAHALKHLPCDSVHDIKKLDNHLFVEFLLACVSYDRARVGAL